ncbi:MAG: aspartate-semialdehyde dehydrogenase [Bacteroidota bacterium]
MKLYDVIVVGATNLVGRKLLSILEERNFPVGRLKLLAADNTVGHEINFKAQSYKVEQVTANSFSDKNMELAFFLAGENISKEFAPIAVANKITVIDDTSFFRSQKEIPLVVPELNSKLLTHHHGIISNPNCLTTILALVLRDIHLQYNIKRVVVTTFQSVTGAGHAGVEQLNREMQNEEVAQPKFNFKIARNAIPAIGNVEADGFTEEEKSLMSEVNKVLNDEAIHITATCVRAPIIGGQCLSVNFECAKEITTGDVKHILSKVSGVVLQDDAINNLYPMPLTANNKDGVFVGRIRKDSSAKNAISLYIVSDNLRKGSATNLVQIAEEVIKLKP